LPNKYKVGSEFKSPSTANTHTKEHRIDRVYWYRIDKREGKRMIYSASHGLIPIKPATQEAEILRITV
jgi:hypothetical protein